MPRSRKTATGAPAQPVEAMTGQQYGRAKVQEALQQAMPVPAPTPVTAPTTQTSAPTETQPAPQPRPRLTPEQAMSVVSGMGGVLSAPDDNPALPITDGLSTGPGRGPEVFQNQSTFGDTLRRLAMQTNDPIFMELASKVSF